MARTTAGIQTAGPRVATGSQTRQGPHRPAARTQRSPHRVLASRLRPLRRAATGSFWGPAQGWRKRRKKRPWRAQTAITCYGHCPPVEVTDGEAQEQDAWQPGSCVDSARRPWAHTGARLAHGRAAASRGSTGHGLVPGRRGTLGGGLKLRELDPPPPGNPGPLCWDRWLRGSSRDTGGPAPQDHGKGGLGAAATRSCCTKHSALWRPPRGAPGARAGRWQRCDASSPVPGLQLAQTGRGVGVGGRPPFPENPALLLLGRVAQAWLHDTDAHTCCDSRHPAPGCAPQKRNGAENPCVSIKGGFTRNSPGPPPHPLFPSGLQGRR